MKVLQSGLADEAEKAALAFVKDVDRLLAEIWVEENEVAA
jgi:hypothetical protein